MENYIGIEDKKGLVRDLSTGAILNFDVEEYRRNKSLREREKLRKLELQQQREEIETLKDELFAMKKLLQDFILSKSTIDK